MNKILTFSIAAYNVEQYIEETLDTLLAIKDKELIEVIVVNDGSKDNTVAIVKPYCEKYPSIVKLIDKSNGGHGSTINSAIAAASGKYFKVLDGDDWVDVEGLQSLVEYLNTSDVDLVLTDLTEVYCDGDKRFFNKVTIKGLIPNTVHLIDEDSLNVYISMHKISIKTRLFKENNVRMLEHCFYVDALYDVSAIMFASTLIYKPINVYIYRLGRVGQSVSSESALHNIEMYNKVYMVICDIIVSHKLSTSRYNLIKIRSSVVSKTYARLAILKNSKEYYTKLTYFASNLEEKSTELYNDLVTNKIVKDALMSFDNYQRSCRKIVFYNKVRKTAKFAGLYKFAFLFKGKLPI